MDTDHVGRHSFQFNANTPCQARLYGVPCFKMFGAQQSGCSPTQSFVHTAAEAAECNSNVNLRFSCQQVLSESKCRLSCIGHVPFLCHLVLLVIRVFALLSFGLSCFFSFSPVLLVHHPKMSQINHFWIVFLLFPL